MVVNKKSGKSEAFSEDKLTRSIVAASDSTKEYLNDSDIKFFISDFLHIVDGKESINSAEIAVIVIGLLYTHGLHKTLEAYYHFGK